MITHFKITKHMNKQLIMSIMLGTFLALFASTTQAQATMAALSQEGILQLPTNEAVKSTYMIDISGLTFSGEEEMKSFFESRSNDLITYRIMASEAKAIVMIHRPKRPEWNIINWNSYLLEQTTLNPIRN